MTCIAVFSYITCYHTGPISFNQVGPKTSSMGSQISQMWHMIWWSTVSIRCSVVHWHCIDIGKASFGWKLEGKITWSEVIYIPQGSYPLIWNGMSEPLYLPYNRQSLGHPLMWRGGLPVLMWDVNSPLQLFWLQSWCSTPTLFTPPISRVPIANDLGRMNSIRMTVDPKQCR